MLEVEMLEIQMIIDDIDYKMLKGKYVLGMLSAHRSVCYRHTL